MRHLINTFFCQMKLRTTLSQRHIFSGQLLYKTKLNDQGLEAPDNVDSDTDKEYEVLSSRLFGAAAHHNLLVVHPYVKWGRQKVTITRPEEQLVEAVALVRTLAPWTVQDTLAVPLESLQRKTLFGSGTLDKLRKRIRGDKRITGLFVNVSTLKNVQCQELEREFGVPVLDRYLIVMRILRAHAITAESRLQVALAELPYMWSRMREHHSTTGHLMASSDWDTRRLLLRRRENALRKRIAALRGQRTTLREKRARDQQGALPVVAVVGYTNAGKTSLIRALTGDESLRPHDRLFATLDVTAHAGLLPSGIRVLYMDTVGFLADIPTDLIECFIATLEDVLMADVILHVLDMKSEDRLHQQKHVEDTLRLLERRTGTSGVLAKTLTVGNKCDTVADFNDVAQDVTPVSSTTDLGIDALRVNIESALMSSGGQNLVTVIVPSGGQEIGWLYKNTTVRTMTADANAEFQRVDIIVSDAKLSIFRHHFAHCKILTG